MRRVVRKLVAGVLGGAALGIYAASCAATAHSDPWHPMVPGIPGPGVNIGIPGNPLPPGQVKQFIPNVDDMVPNWGAPGQWR